MGSTGFEVVVNSYIIQPEITVNIGESYLNVTNLNGKDQVSANMQIVHNILNNDVVHGGTEVKTKMLIAA
jgi:hypothetical protein